MNTNTTGIAAARQAHSARCRQRVIAALEQSAHQGSEISVSAIARRAKVDPQLPLSPPRPALARPGQSRRTDQHQDGRTSCQPRASLIADLANPHDRITRLSRENTQLRQRLSERLGEQIWRESGLGGPDDIDRLQRRVTELEQHAAKQRRQLAERNDELEAARAANRDLMTHLNQATPRD